jgi:Uncharacterized conserved protein
MAINYVLIGKAVIWLTVFLIFFNMLALALGLYSIKKKKIIFPHFVLFTLYLFYAPTKWVFSIFSIHEFLVDIILVEIQNAISLEKFKKQDQRKVVLLPQCLRSSNCIARCDPLYGFVCIKCGRCDIGEILKEAEPRDFKVFVIPGSSFVKKIFKEYRPTSCIGVACPVELSESMQKTSIIPSQGVYLLNDGCFETRVNVSEVVEKMELVSPFVEIVRNEDENEKSVSDEEVKENV